jgi:hypothetical protein
MKLRILSHQTASPGASWELEEDMSHDMHPEGQSK